MWRDTGLIPRLAVGQRDASDELRVPQKLYGREQEIESLVLARLRATLPTHGRGGLDGLATEVAAGRLDAYTAADRVLEHP